MTDRALAQVAAVRAAGSLRERKKQRTREAIQREAIRLFQEQGYDSTTIEQIAAAVEISPSTFFNYFPNKEDVIAFDPYDPLLLQAFAERPPDEPLGIALRRMLEVGFGAALERDRDLILNRAGLALEVPELRSRLWEEMERGQDMLRGAIAERLERDPDNYELRVIAGTVTGALFVAVMEWARNGGRADLIELCSRALDVVEAGAGLDAVARG